MSITTSTIITTDYGEFTVSYHKFKEGSCVSLSIGDLSEENTLVRLQSSCVFSESFHTFDCDCSLQLSKALDLISKVKKGVLVYRYEEGRGIGLENKIRSLYLERTDKIDTVDAFKKLGFELDPRDYKLAIKALVDLKVNKKIKVITNNPNKIKRLEDAGYEIVKRIVLQYPTTRQLRNYLKMKKNRMGHKISEDMLE